MRRSKAPSVLNKTKRKREDGSCSDAEDQYDWGSLNSKSKKLNINKRIFNVLWRDVSTRKHKIWKGDGTLEVDSINFKAILKDETGKYMGCSTKIDINEFIPDFQMIISGKEVEIQNEIEADEELQNLCKMQAENFANMECAYREDKLEEAKKPKGGFKFKPVLVLNSPKLTPCEKTLEKENFNFEEGASTLQNQYQYLKDNSNGIEPYLVPCVKTKLCNEFICFLKPSELQQFLFQKVLDYISFSKPDYIHSLDVELVLKLICNHPSLINHKTTTNELLQHLIPFLPEWSDMGPFDSCKLEFVQHFIADLTKSNPQICFILAKNINVLNMLQGLCDFMKIKYLRLNSNNMQNFGSQISNFCSPENVSIHVILINSWDILSSSKLPALSKKIIVYEDCLEFSNACSAESFDDLTIYYLVTSFSIEELFLLGMNNGNLLNDLPNIMNKEHDSCYVHSKIGCYCFESSKKTLSIENDFIKYWNHYKPPFKLQLLKASSLENSSENIVSIFCRKAK